VALPGVIVIVTGTVTSGVNETAAVALLVGSAALVAVTVTFCALVIVKGAVYTPPEEIVPICGLIDQETPELLVPLTVATNCCD